MSVIPAFESSGNLPPGEHLATRRQIVARLAFTARRKELIIGLFAALTLLKTAGCRLVYLDGSFVTRKPDPGDFDACWGTDGVDVQQLDPVFLDFSNSRARQKERFLGEFFPAELPEGATGKTFLDSFRRTRRTGWQKAS